MDGSAGLLFSRLVPHLGVQAHVLRIMPRTKTHILGSQILQEGNHVVQLRIGRVINERNALDSVPRLELEALGRIVNDHDGAQITTQKTQILHEHAI